MRPSAPLQMHAVRVCNFNFFASLRALKAAHKEKERPFFRMDALSFEWWSWRELNPRPQAFIGQIYMLSGLI